MTKALTTTQPRSLTTPTNDLIEILVKGLSENSKRQYAYTFNDWRAWCAQQPPAILPDDLTAVNVMHYLESRNLSRSTAQNRLSHLRQFVETMSLADPDNHYLQQCYAQLKWLKLGVDWKTPVSDDAKGKKRKGQYIDPARVHELLASYPVEINGKPYMKGLRNRALLAVLFYGGLRRFEAAKLEWSHIDFDEQTITIVGGKARDREHEDIIPFIGSIERYLQEWRKYLPDRRYLFPRVLRGDHLGADKPITPDGLYKQFKDDFAPHDARRTLISGLLKSGSYIGDVKVISRHSSESTLLKYAKSHDAKVVGGRVKLDY